MKTREHATAATAPHNASFEWIRTYNRLQDRINAFILEGRAVPVELENASFAMVASCYA